MVRTITGIAVATLVLYLWGFLYWGVSTLPYTAWKQTTNDQQTQQMLTEYFPESGTYYIPGRQHDPEEIAQLYESGPTGFVHIAHGPSLELDPKIMITGVFLDLVVVALMALLFKTVGVREGKDFAKLSVLAGAISVVAIDFGDIVWWQLPVDWKLWQAFYDFTVWPVAGLMLALFMRQSRNPSNESA